MASQTRCFFWDGVPNVVDGRLQDSDCKFTLSSKEEVPAAPKASGPRTLYVAPGAQAVPITTKLASCVRIRETDESFTPGENLLTVKLRLRPVDDNTTLLVRVYREKTLVFHEVYAGFEIRRMLTVDPRPTATVREPGKAEKVVKRMPRANVQSERTLRRTTAPPGTYTVRAWLAQQKGAFDRTAGLADAQIGALAGVTSHLTPRAQGSAAETKRIQEKYGDKLGRNQTVVRSAGYKKAQCVAFHIEPVTREVNGEDVYVGFASATDDIDARCAIMTEGITTAFAHEGIDKKPGTLKIFMAPEFFFRGSEGAYPVEKVSRIMEVLRAETQKPIYKDWLFVLGTAIGYLKHGEDAAVEHRISVQKARVDAALIATVTVRNPVLEVGGRPDPSGKRAPRAGFESADICARAIVDRWELSQGGRNCVIEGVRRVEQGVYELTLGGDGSFIEAGAATLVEPASTEVFNIAFVQKGGDNSDARIIYKDEMSAIDFLGNYYDTQAFYATHLAKLHGDDDRTLLPTEGSKDDYGGAVRNLVGQRTPSGKLIGEVNKTGIGGGSVFTQDGITFGLEVCLDHGQGRLLQFYASNPPAGTPRVQVQLIPSYGMSINAATVVCVTGGIAFNVDGKNHGTSAVRVNKRKPGEPPLEPQQPLPRGKRITVSVGHFFEADTGEVRVYPAVDLPPAATL